MPTNQNQGGNQGNQGGQQGSGRGSQDQNQNQNQSGRGFAGMDDEQQRKIAKKGGDSVSQDREHMSDIGRKGGGASGGNRGGNQGGTQGDRT